MLSLLMLPLALLSLVLTTDGGDPPAGDEGKPDSKDGNDGNQGDQTNANAGGQQGGGSGVTFTPEQQAYLDKLVGTARTEGRNAAQAEAKRKADEDAAAAKGEWEKLAAARQAEIDRLAAEIATRDHDALRAKVAAKHKLPADLASRLVGDDEAALEDDARALAKLVAARPPVDTEAGAGQGGAANQGSRSKTVEKTPSVTFDGKPIVAFPPR
jgi:hypothetical protein